MDDDDDDDERLLLSYAPDGIGVQRKIVHIVMMRFVPLSFLFAIYERNTYTHICKLTDWLCT